MELLSKEGVGSKRVGNGVIKHGRGRFQEGRMSRIAFHTYRTPLADQFQGRSEMFIPI